MKTLTDYSLKFALVLILISATSCAPKKIAWTSTPEYMNAENSYYKATITPNRDSDRFFVSFNLDVVNKSAEELHIDWNKTMYMYNGSSYGGFVFKGIKPEDLKDLSIPDGIIPPGAKFTEIISPSRMIAKRPLNSNKDQAFSPGILPNGKNGINLVITENGKEIVEQLSVIIREIKE